MRVLNYTRAMLTFLNYRTNCARRQRKFITGTAKMEPGGEWICGGRPADALLISVLHYKHPVRLARLPLVLPLWASFDGRFFVSLSLNLVYKRAAPHTQTNLTFHFTVDETRITLDTQRSLTP